MIRSLPVAVLLVFLGGWPASAQIAGSTAGNVGSVVLRNGYPTGAGAIALPSLAGTTPGVTGAGLLGGNPANGAAGATAVSSSAAVGITSGGGSRGGSPGGSGSGSSGTGGARAARGGAVGGRNNWVLCPPDGSSGLDPLFAGTDLSCAPN